MKIKAFHQFVILEKGPVNTAIIDLLKGNVFQVENELIEKFSDRRYQEIHEFIHSLKTEELIIEIDQRRWIPRIMFNEKEEEDISFDLEVEEGLDFDLIKEKFIFIYREGMREISFVNP